MNIFTQQISKVKKQWAIITLLVVLVISATLVYAQEGPILEMTTYSSKLSNPDLTPGISIYADGVIEIYHPRYMKKSGLYRGKLTSHELNEVKQLMELSLIHI